MEKLFGKTIDTLISVLDYRSQRHNVIASNIANIDTPHYSSKDLIFEKELGMALSNRAVSLHKTHEKHLPTNQESLNEKGYEIVETDKSVNIDREMATLTENQLMYTLSVDLLARKFKGLNTVLKEVK